ncbi:galactose-specific lectin nattectin-like [Micropterus salmoides]|uniref:galactose-specific lectin nattectin-like n=1 Tax=Micropterus salmoides TaxID=27706 RepID=UPI0018EB6675|nr:galactose-specific lectin nattectin-like [Micropterus salmoides]
MASGLHFIGLLCMTSGLWIGANAQCGKKSGDCPATCPTGWIPFGQNCFLFQLGEMDWATAERFCTSLGGNLASIQTPEVYAVIRDLIFRSTNSQKATWVGGYDAAKEGVWLWSDGSKWDFKGWAAGEPNNVGRNENCMHINFAGRDYVNDSDCASKNSVICAKRL